MIGTEETRRIVRDMAREIEKNVEYLTRLDQVIGDGDHGVNLVKGFRAVHNRLDELRGKDVGKILKDVGMTLVATAGGAAGPLYGTAFMKAGEAVEGKSEIDVDDLYKMLEAAERGVADIGGASPGEKTMLDAIHPAVMAVKKAAENRKPLLEALEIGVEAGEEGMKSTINMISRRGRSSYQGERSRGHQDVGATSVCIIMRSAFETLKGLNDK